MYYELVKNRVEEMTLNGEETDPMYWMDGQWMPLSEQLDPAADPPCQMSMRSIFFPLKGNFIVIS